MTAQTLLILPALLLVLLTFTVLFIMGSKRFKAAKARQVDAKYYRLYQDGVEPEPLRKMARNYENLFEMPVLFYFAIGLTLLLQYAISPVMLALAWGYFILRALHSYIHCTSNKVIWRFRLFLLSAIVLLSYWLILGYQILLSTSL